MTYVEHLIILMCIYIILAVSLNLIIGFTGLLNLGHAAFFGIGAYASALLTLAGIPFIISFIASFLIAAAFGFLISVPCLRLRGDYLAIATLGFGEIARSIVKNWTELTRGPLGIPGIPKASFIATFNTPLKFLMLAVVIAALSYAIISRIVNSPFGRVLRAIREDEVAAQALGKNVTKYKVLAVVIGAAFAGLAGSLYAHYISFIDPSIFSLTETILMVIMVVLGGAASLPGSVVGATILMLLPEPLRFLQLPSSVVAALRQLIYAALLILIIILKPDGLIKEKRTGQYYGKSARS